MPRHPPVAESQSWHRLPDETPHRFAWFQVYLDLGPSRTLTKAYRSSHGPDSQGYPTKSWKDAFKRGRWEERAAAYDRHAGDVMRRAVGEAASSSTHQWAARRDQQLEADWETAQKLMLKARALISFPVQKQTVHEDRSEDGRRVTITRVYEPIGAADMKRAAEVYMAASHMAHAAIGRACPDFVLSGVSRVEELAANAAVRDMAAQELEAWRAEQRTKILAIPSSAPTEDGAQQPPGSADAI